MMHIALQRPVAQYLFGLWLALFAGASIFAQTSGNCGVLSTPGQYGPFDYRGDQRPQAIVLSVHFTAEVEALIRGKTSREPGGDIDYTLRAIPNNHRALMAMMRLGQRDKTTKPNGSNYTIDCWFERAILFRPDDGIVRMIYSSYLNSKSHISEATAQLEIATTYAKDSAFTHYNIGLHYFDLKNYDKALVQAHMAMSLGFPRTELRDQLQAVGKWSAQQEQPPAPSTSDTTVEPLK